MPPIVRAWKKGARATFSVYESFGEDEGRVEVRYIAQIRIGEPGTAVGKISRRSFETGGKKARGISPTSEFQFGYGIMGPVAGQFVPGMGGGNALVWAMSAPGWGGTGFRGKYQPDGYHGEGLFGDAEGKATVMLKTHLRKDGWPQRVKVELSTPEGGYTADIRRI